MRVLWFTNTPCGAAEKLGTIHQSGGWLNSLQEELVNIPDVDLSICFYHHQNIRPFEFRNTHYYPIYRERKKNRVSRAIKRFIGDANKEEKEISELLNVISSLAPDVIHIHGTEENFGLVQRHIETPVIVSIQGILNPLVEKFNSGIPLSISSKHEGVLAKIALSSTKVQYLKFKKRAERELEILKNTKYVFGRTDWDRRVTSILSPNSKYFFGSEVLRPLFYLSNWNKKQFNTVLQIVTITNDVVYKGFETIVNTAKLISECTDLQFTWKVIGLNEKSNVVKIVNHWKKDDLLRINIDLLGNKNEAEVINILLESDIYCQVSHIENSPNSLCEAMALGMPVIASFSGGTSSIIECYSEGILVQDGDQYSLAGAIVEMVRDQQKAIEYGRNAKKRAMIRHNKEDIISKLLLTYNSIVE